MDLNQLSFNARNRTPWQVFDLTILMVKKHFLPMIKIIISLYLPLVILLQLAFSTTTASLILWWLKPVIERPLLDFLAKKSFSQPTTTWSCIASLKQLKFADIFMMLTLYRFSPNRVYLSPIEQLEKLSGKKRSSRKNVFLGRCDHKQTTWLLICLHMELILTMLFLAVAYNFIPQGTYIDDQFVFQSLANGDLELAYFYCYIIALVLVMPYFATGGFLTYLNGRIKLEAWDIELAFKRIVKSRALALLLPLFVCFNFTYSPDSSANETVAVTVDTRLENSNKQADITRQEIADLYKEKQWIKTQTSWQPIIDDEENQEMDLSWLELFAFLKHFGALFAYIAWGLVIIFCLWLAYKLYQVKGRMFIDVNAKTNNANKPAKSDIPIFFNEIVEDIAPTQLLALAIKENEQNNLRKALMYLLQYSLFFAEQSAEVKLHKSMSEMECQSALLEVLPSENHHLYKRLFSTWIQQAWAHRNASREDVKNLIDEFQSLNGAAA